MRVLVKLVALVGLAGAAAAADEPTRPVAPAPRATGFLADPNVFPIAAWLPSPARAPDYKAVGINLDVGLWTGPTEDQLADLKRHGMRVVCPQNAIGVKHLDDPTIVAWVQGDEPDNAQSLGKGKGYDPPVAPAKVVEDYERLKKADPSRPVLLNLGQGVAWDKYVGRGTRTNHPEDYPEYLKGCDIASFDTCPAGHDHRDVAGKLWFVADGVSRLRKWTDDRKPVWNCIECTHVSDPRAKATPKQVKAGVWMSLVRGSRGLIYFGHQFQPKFIEAGLLDDKEVAAAVGAINKQIHELAPVLNGPMVADGVSVSSSASEVPVEATVKRRDGTTYLFAVGGARRNDDRDRHRHRADREGEGRGAGREPHGRGARRRLQGRLRTLGRPPLPHPHRVDDGDARQFGASLWGCWGSLAGDTSGRTTELVSAPLSGPGRTEVRVAAVDLETGRRGRAVAGVEAEELIKSAEYFVRRECVPPFRE